MPSKYLLVDVLFPECYGNPQSFRQSREPLLLEKTKVMNSRNYYKSNRIVNSVQD